jgi:hypothetical protein
VAGGISIGGWNLLSYRRVEFTIGGRSSLSAGGLHYRRVEFTIGGWKSLSAGGIS